MTDLHPDLPPETPSWESPRSRRPPPSKRPSGVCVASLVISLLALAVSSVTLFLVLRDLLEPEPPPEPPEPETFQFGGVTLEALDGMPRNAWDPAGFSADERGRVTYYNNDPRTAGVTVRAGVDVSTHQKEIDWEAVAADGVEFAMLRLGHRGYGAGGLFLDQAFERNLQGALDAGLDVGVYFFSQALNPREAEEEAAYLLGVLDGRKLSFPVAYDWESIPDDAARTDGVDGETVTRCAAAFCEKVKEAGYEPAVYFNRTQGYLHYDLRALKGYKLWLASYGTEPGFYYHFDMWQYSNKGRVAGIDADVDLDLAFW